MANNFLIRAFISALLLQFFVAQTVWATGWHDVAGRMWRDDLYEPSGPQKALRVEVVSRDLPPPDFSSAASPENIVLYIHTVDHEKRGHSLLVDGIVFDFSAGVKRHKVKSLYEGGDIEFWIDQKGNVELLRLDTPYILDLITTGSITTRGFHTKSKIRIGAKEFKNEGTLHAQEFLEIYTSMGDIENTGTMEADAIKLYAKRHVLNQGGCIVGRYLDVKAIDIDNRADGLLSGTADLFLKASRLLMDQGSFFGSKGCFELREIVFNHHSVMRLSEQFVFEGVSFKLDGESILESLLVKLNVGEVVNRGSTITGKAGVQIDTAHFSNEGGTISSGGGMSLKKSDKSVELKSGQMVGFSEAETFSNLKGTLSAQGSVFFDTGTLGFNNQGGHIHGRRVSLQSSAKILNHEGSITGQRVGVAARSFLNGSGTLKGSRVAVNTTLPSLKGFQGNIEETLRELRQGSFEGLFSSAGVVEGKDVLTLYVEGLRNSGRISSFGDVQVQGILGLYNAGEIHVLEPEYSRDVPKVLFKQKLKITTQGPVLSSGEKASIQSAGSLWIQSLDSKILLEKGSMIASTSLLSGPELHGVEGIEVRNSSIFSLHSMTLNIPKGFINTGGRILVENGDVKLRARSLYNHGKNGVIGALNLIFCIEEDLFNREGALFVARDLVSLTADYFDNRGGHVTGDRVHGHFVYNPNPRLEESLSSNHNPYATATKKADKKAEETSAPGPTRVDGVEGEDVDKALHEPVFPEPEAAAPLGEETTQSKKGTKETGHLINTGGSIEAQHEIDIRGLGDIYNAEKGLIKSLEGPLRLSALGRVLNQGESLIRAGGAAEVTAERGILSNEGGSLIEGSRVTLGAALSLSNFGKEGLPSTIVGHKTLDLRLIHKLYNIDGIIEGGDSLVFPSHKLLLSNSGRIYSRGPLELSSLVLPLGEVGVNAGGVLESGTHIVFREEGVLPKKIGGTLKAPRVQFLSDRMVVGDRNSHCFKDLLGPTVFDTSDLRFEFPHLQVSLMEDLTLPLGFYATVKKWTNTRRLKTLAGRIYIHSLSDIINLVDYSTRPGGENLYPFSYDHFIGKTEDSRIVVLQDNSFHFSEEQRPSFAFFEGAGGVVLETPRGKIRNYGGIWSGAEIILRAPFVQNGWAQKDDHLESLEEGTTDRRIFDWKHHYFKPQDAFMKSVGPLIIESEKFLNTFGRVDAGLGLDLKTGLFFNFAGDIVAAFQPEDYEIQAQVFINTLGLIETSIVGRRYWSIDFANTGPAFLNVIHGKLKISTAYARNSGSFIHGEEGVFLNSLRVDNAEEDARFNEAINEHAQLAYTRTVTVEGTDTSCSTKKVCGISCGKSKAVTHWRHHYPETRSRGTLMSTISAGGSVEIREFEHISQAGLIHGSYTLLQARDGGVTHGYQQNIGLAPRLSLPSFLDFREILKESIGERDGEVYGYLPRALGAGSSTTQSSELFFTILDNGCRGYLPQTRLVFPVSELEDHSLHFMQTALGTGRLPFMENLKTGSKKAYDEAIDAENLSLEQAPFLTSLASPGTEIRLIKPEQVREGLYFKIEFLEEGYPVLVPVLHFPSLHQSVFRPDGSTVADGILIGEKPGVVEMRTSGSMSLTGAIFGKAAYSLYAEKGIEAHTRHRTEYASTKREGGSLSGGRFINSVTRGEVTEHHHIHLAESVTSFETEGDGVIEVGRGATINLTGVQVRTGGSHSMNAPDGTIKVAATETESVRRLFEGSRSSILYPTFLPTSIWTIGSNIAKARDIENIASHFVAEGNITIEASKRLRQRALERSFIVGEFLNTINKRFGSRVESTVETATVHGEPETRSTGANVKLSAEEIEATGRIMASQGWVDISGGKSVVFAGVEVISGDGGTRITAPFLIARGRYEKTGTQRHTHRQGLGGGVIVDDDINRGKFRGDIFSSSGRTDMETFHTSLHGSHIGGNAQIKVDADEGTFTFADGYDYTEQSSVSRGRNFWGTREDTRVSMLHSRSSGGDLTLALGEAATLSGHDIRLVNTGLLGRGRVSVKGHKFYYELGKEETQFTRSSSSPGLWWQDFEQESSHSRVSTIPRIEASLDIEADEVFLEHPVDQNTLWDNVMLSRGQANYIPVHDFYQHEFISHSAPGALTNAVVALGVNCLIPGGGTVWAQMGYAALGTGVSQGIMTGTIDPTDLLISAASAGAFYGISSHSDYLKAANKSTVQGITKTFGQQMAIHMTRSITGGVVSRAFGREIQWGDVLQTSAINAVGALGANMICDWYGTNPDHYWAHKTSHFGLGALMGATLNSRDSATAALAGGVGGVTAEMFAEMLFGGPKELATNPINPDSIRTEAFVSKMVGGIAGTLASQGEHPYIAFLTANNAVENNAVLRVTAQWLRARWLLSGAATGGSIVYKTSEKGGGGKKSGSKESKDPKRETEPEKPRDPKEPKWGAGAAGASAAVAKKYKVPISKLSGKEGAKNVPSWAKGEKPYVGENGKDFAKRLCDKQFGVREYETGAGSAYSKIQKRARAFKDPT